MINRTRFFCLLAALCIGAVFALQEAEADSRPVMVAEIVGTINPATDDYLRSALLKAKERHARVLIIKLNTPGGLLRSMQAMVEQLLESEVPTVVYVSPQGGSAMSAGVFVTMAANIAVMAPGSTIGAAHPVTSGGANIGSDMREKIENYAVSLGRAIAEQRGRNVKWAEQAVRESASITDREAVTERVVDFSASDLSRLIEQLETRTVTVKGVTLNFEGLSSAPQEIFSMSMKQQVVNLLSDPNVVMLLGLGVIFGFGLELLHPGLIVPGIVGLICLILSLVAGQVIPINAGGASLLVLSLAFFIAEAFIPSFGILGVSGIVCLILGSLYFVDGDEIWSVSGFAISKYIIGAAICMVSLLGLIGASIFLRGDKSKPRTGKEGLEGQSGTVLTAFEVDEMGFTSGKVRVMGEIWRARIPERSDPVNVGDEIVVHYVEDGLRLLVRKKST